VAERPLFTETVQIGIVVRDLDAAVRAYEDRFGIGPWEPMEWHAGTAEDYREDGEPVSRAWRGATTMVGSVQWELIEPLDAESIYARFLAEKGEGVHHIAVAGPSFDDASAAGTQSGRSLVLSGTFEGYKVAYLPTDGDLGVIVEIFDPPPGE
jgi:methylmalonyl-CoA/ethylmalonyl-CoA epimerase